MTIKCIVEKRYVSVQKTNIMYDKLYKLYKSTLCY